MSTEEIANSIRQLHKPDSATLVAIDGVGGSGKSTFAQQLMQTLPEAVLIEIDHFYSPLLEKQDLKKLFNDVIQPLKQGLPATYKGTSVAPESIVIIEGVYAMDKDIDKYDYKIWVECDPVVAMQRGIKRSERLGLNEKQIWAAKWLPSELNYRETQKPYEKADVIIDGTIEQLGKET